MTRGARSSRCRFQAVDTLSSHLRSSRTIANMHGGNDTTRASRSDSRSAGSPTPPTEGVHRRVDAAAAASSMRSASASSTTPRRPASISRSDGTTRRATTSSCISLERYWETNTSPHNSRSTHAFPRSNKIPFDRARTSEVTCSNGTHMAAVPSSMPADVALGPVDAEHHAVANS